MKAPNKIYLQVCGSCTEKGCKDCKFEDLEDNVTWYKDRIYKKDIEYIRKDALLEWAEEKLENMKKLSPSDGARIYSNAINDLVDKLNQM